MDADRRFGGIAALYGHEGLERLRRAHVAVIGVGGVGSWVVEALARSALGRLTLVDMDHVAESNINRQLPALSSTLGRAKIQVLAERVTDINPATRIQLVDDFVEAANLDSLLDGGFDAVIDCIDHYREKALIIAGCRRRKQFVVTVGGMGGKVDPTRLGIADLSRTEKDSLLSRTRKELRQRFGFPLNPKRRFAVPAVYSLEDSIRFPEAVPGRGTAGQPSHLNCGGLGSATHVTATAGFLAVGVTLKRLAWPAGQPSQGRARSGRTAEEAPPEPAPTD